MESITGICLGRCHPYYNIKYRHEPTHDRAQTDAIGTSTGVVIPKEMLARRCGVPLGTSDMGLRGATGVGRAHAGTPRMTCTDRGAKFSGLAFSHG